MAAAAGRTALLEEPSAPSRAGEVGQATTTGGGEVSSLGRQVGTLAIQAHWDLERYAYRIPRNEVPKDEAFRLAESLNELARVIRLHHSEVSGQGTESECRS